MRQSSGRHRFRLMQQTQREDARCREHGGENLNLDLLLFKWLQGEELLFLSLVWQWCIIGNSEYITQSSKSTPTYVKTTEVRKRDWVQFENSRSTWIVMLVSWVSIQWLKSYKEVTSKIKNKTNQKPVESFLFWFLLRNQKSACKPGGSGARL